MDSNILILAGMMLVTLGVYFYRIRHIKRYWKNFILEAVVFIIVQHMMEGVTGMEVALLVNFVFIIFAKQILIITGFEKKEVK